MHGQQNEALIMEKNFDNDKAETIFESFRTGNKFNNDGPIKDKSDLSSEDMDEFDN
jgi:hypothetical protein